MVGYEPYDYDFGPSTAAPVRLDDYDLGSFN
jgi:DNA-directed RNA polymerase subunit beta'